MRVATLMLPNFDNDGRAIPEVHTALQDNLLDAFGGYSQLPAVGAWRDPQTGRVYRDSNTQYAIAMDDTPGNVAALRNVAMRAGVAAEQLAVMVTLPNGNVEFLETQQPAMAA